MPFDITTFVNLVRQMRKAQASYFKTKDYNAMVDSMKFEGMVDKKIKEFDEAMKYNNKDLFNQGELPF